MTLDLSDNGMGPQGGTYMAAALADNEFILNVVRLHQCLDHLFLEKIIYLFLSLIQLIMLQQDLSQNQLGVLGALATGRYAKAEQGNEDTELIK